MGGVLKGDEVHQVALGRSHAVREEVDQGVEELRPLGVRLVHVRESWREGEEEKMYSKYVAKYRKHVFHVATESSKK